MPDKKQLIALAVLSTIGLILFAIPVVSGWTNRREHTAGRSRS
jgi:hypothetical protein